jgi:glycerol uptake facilitator-like aquaporin
VVSLVSYFVDKDSSIAVLVTDVVAQVAGAIVGCVIANIMFAHPFIEMSTKVRTGGPTWFSEVVATVGLLVVIWGGKRAGANVAVLVAAWITGAYWFTSSTSFANPTLTFARSLTDTFDGIAPASVPAFVAAQLAGALCAHWVDRAMHPAP